MSHLSPVLVFRSSASLPDSRVALKIPRGGGRDGGREGGRERERVNGNCLSSQMLGDSPLHAR